MAKEKENLNVLSFIGSLYLLSMPCVLHVLLASVNKNVKTMIKNSVLLTTMLTTVVHGQFY